MSALYLERLEDRRLLASFIFTTTETGGVGVLQVHSDRDLDGVYETISAEFKPFADVKAPIRAVAADFDGDGNAEIAVALAAKSPQVKIYHLGSDGSLDGLLDSFFAFDPKQYHCGVNLAAGQFDGQGGYELVTAADAGAKPSVSIWGDPNQDGKFSDHAVLDTLQAEGLKFKGGIRVAAGDVNNDGFDELLTAPGKGAPGVIRVYDDAKHDGVFSDDAYTSLTAYSPTYTGGLSIASARLSGIGSAGAEIIYGPDAGALPLQVWTDLSGDGTPDATISGGYPLGLTWTGGMRIAAGDANGDGKADIIVAPASGASKVKVQVLGDNGDADTNPFNNAPLDSFFAFSGKYSAGAAVAFGQVLTAAVVAPSMPKFIPDNGTLQSSLRVGPAMGIVRSLTVSLSIMHAKDSELTVTLSHGATSLVLFTGINGDNAGFMIKLDDLAATDIAAAPPAGPLVGTFNPQGPVGLSTFSGQNAAGLWTLTIADGSAGNTGVLYSWSLGFGF